MKPTLPDFGTEDQTEPSVSCPTGIPMGAQPVAETSGVDAKSEIHYAVKVFRWSDGKYGGNVTFSKKGVPGEEITIKNEVNNFAATALRDLDETLKKLFS